MIALTGSQRKRTRLFPAVISVSERTEFVSVLLQSVQRADPSWATQRAPGSHRYATD